MVLVEMEWGMAHHNSMQSSNSHRHFYTNLQMPNYNRSRTRLGLNSVCFAENCWKGMLHSAVGQ